MSHQGRTFQIRSKTDGRSYRPGRDLSYLYPRIVGHAITNLARTSWTGAMKKYAEDNGVTDQAMVDAGTAMGIFIASVTKTGVSFQDAAANAGLDRLPGPSLMMIFFAIGMSTTEAFFQCIREVTVQGQTPPDCDRVAQLADRAAHALTSDSMRVRRNRADAMSTSITSEDLFMKED